MTNYEKMKEWSIDDWLDSCILTCKQCIFDKVCTADNSDCDDGIRRWLESEVEEMRPVANNAKDLARVEATIFVGEMRDLAEQNHIEHEWFISEVVKTINKYKASEGLESEGEE